MTSALHRRRVKRKGGGGTTPTCLHDMVSGSFSGTTVIDYFQIASFQTDHSSSLLTINHIPSFRD